MQKRFYMGYTVQSPTQRVVFTSENEPTEKTRFPHEEDENRVDAEAKGRCVAGVLVQERAVVLCSKELQQKGWTKEATKEWTRVKNFATYAVGLRDVHDDNLARMADGSIKVIDASYNTVKETKMHYQEKPVPVPALAGKQLTFNL